MVRVANSNAHIASIVSPASFFEEDTFSVSGVQSGTFRTS
jgi:hypothetical protein